MKNKILFILTTISSVIYLVAYPFLSSAIPTILFTVTGILIFYLFWNIKTDLKSNRTLKVGLWIITVSVLLIPRLFFQPDTELSYKVIWTLLVFGALLFDMNREFKWFNS